MPLPIPETNSEDDEEPIRTADLDNTVWTKSQYQTAGSIFHEIPRLAIPTPTPQPRPVTQPLQPNQGFSTILPGNLTK